MFFWKKVNPEGEHLTVAKAEAPPQTPPAWPRGSLLFLEPGNMWCWYQHVTLAAGIYYSYNAWPGGEREGRAAFATLSASPRRFHIFPNM